ncbi:hypothetical protein CesoFtcFv8_002821 [Champsocephalus esox]|uniref:Uncharacterized protein n=1 Tax=Champsocephalus esox TaxID=159716 RepID=A0AAN8HET1_9TELE|nr:hypothetical protein CesoFtcFv8_002821 [Champsocephalus esox]
MSCRGQIGGGEIGVCQVGGLVTCKSESKRAGCHSSNTRGEVSHRIHLLLPDDVSSWCYSETVRGVTHNNS